jgi:hypothetical protein
MPVLPPKISGWLVEIWTCGAGLTSGSTPKCWCSGKRNYMYRSLSVIAHELVEKIHIQFIIICEELSEIQTTLWRRAKTAQIGKFWFAPSVLLVAVKSTLQFFWAQKQHNPWRTDRVMVLSSLNLGQFSDFTSIQYTSSVKYLDHRLPCGSFHLKIQ